MSDAPAFGAYTEISADGMTPQGPDGYRGRASRQRRAGRFSAA